MNDNQRRVSRARLSQVAALAMAVVVGGAPFAQAQGAQAGAPPATAQVPGGAVPAGRGAGPSTSAPPAIVARTFSGRVGLAFNTVRPDRVTEFETLLAEVQQALARASTPSTQAQAKAWKFYKAAETGPNGSVMYVFVIDPVSPGEDYSLGKVLVEAFPDAAKLQEVWKLYTGSVTGGGTLLNLNPVAATAPARGRGAAPAATIPTPAELGGGEALPRMLPPGREGGGAPPR